MPLYEHVFLARQDISAQQVTGLVEEYEGIVNNLGGKFERTEAWGLRTLAFKIKKNRKAHYTLINIDAPHAAIAEMERQMRINESVIRYLTLKVDKFDENPSIMMQKRDRDERRRREREERIARDASDGTSGELESTPDSTEDSEAPTTLADTIENPDSASAAELEQSDEQPDSSDTNLTSEAPEPVEPSTSNSQPESVDQVKSADSEQPADQPESTDKVEPTKADKKVEKEGVEND